MATRNSAERPAAAPRPRLTIRLQVAEERYQSFLQHPALAAADHRTRTAITDIYYDTGRLHLRRAGIRLRLRRGDAGWEQQLTAADSCTAGGPGGGRWDSPYRHRFDFAAVDDPEIRAWLEREKIAARLAPLFEASYRRLACQLTPSPVTMLAVRFDRGWLSASGRRETVCDLELQLLAGPAKELFDIADLLAERQPLLPLPRTKAERGYLLYLDRAAQPATDRAVALDRALAPGQAFRLIAANCAAHLHLNHAGAIAADDPEYMHQMRIALRRLQTAIRMFRPLLSDEVRRRLAPTMRNLMQSLGRARDLDVLLTRMVAPAVQALPGEPGLIALAGTVTDRLEEARSAVRGLLQSPAYGQMLLQANRLSWDASPTAKASDEAEARRLDRFADRRLRRLLKQVGELAGNARKDDPPSLHRLRIAIKRLRYGIEFMAPLIADRHGRHLIKRLGALQDDLGQLNDLAIAGELLIACTADRHDLRPAVDLIETQQRSRRTALRKAVAGRLKTIRGLTLPRLD